MSLLPLSNSTKQAKGRREARLTKDREAAAGFSPPDSAADEDLACSASSTSRALSLKAWTLIQQTLIWRRSNDVHQIAVMVSSRSRCFARLGLPEGTASPNTTRKRMRAPRSLCLCLSSRSSRPVGAAPLQRIRAVHQPRSLPDLGARTIFVRSL